MKKIHYAGKLASPGDRNDLLHIVYTAKRDGAIITTHGTPDVDGIGGCFALQRHLAKKGAPADIVTGKTIPLTDPLVEKLGVKLRGWHTIEPTDPRPAIVVDTNSPSLLTGCTRKEFLAVIDHHEESPQELHAAYKIISRKAVSVCEIIASLIPENDLDRLSALALAVGIAGDSNRLRDIDDETLPIFDRLVEISCESKKTIDALALPPLSPQVAAAVMEELKHVSTDVYRGRTISVGASGLDNPAILASKIVELDIAVTAVLGLLAGSASADENLYKISFRVRHQEVREGIYANAIARMTSEKCGMPPNMHGGGHEDKAAAVVNGKYADIVGAVFAAAKECIDSALAPKP